MMEDRSIRSRRPLRSGNNANYSPAHGSPIRRNDRQSSPNYSGSEDDEADLEIMDIENRADVTASTNSTFNSSSDIADGIKCSRYVRTEGNIKFYPDGTVKELNVTKTKKDVIRPKVDQSHNTVFWLIIVVVVIIVSAALFSNKIGQSDAITDRRQRCSFEQSKHDFPKQNKILWKSLEKGVESVLNDIPTSPSIFLLAYEDVGSANRITRSIVDRATECMDSRVNALVLSPADLAYSEMKSDYGIVITKYQNQLRNSGVMLVNDLNKVPSKVAPAFHVFCDVQNPLVDRSIIFLTVQLNQQIQTSSNANVIQVVENYLRSNWSDLENFVLEPLITRVTDQVFVLQKE